MASGKTSLGSKLAKQLKLDFFDLDQQIESSVGMDIPQIFQQNGQKHFRTLEEKTLREISAKNQNFVMSCGGGSPCYSDNMQYMKSMGITVFLDVDQEILLGRLRKGKSQRPLVAGMDDIQIKEFIEQKYLERREFYLQSQFVLKENNPRIDQIMELLGDIDDPA